VGLRIYCLLSLYVCVTFKLPNQSTDFHEILLESYAIGGHPILIVSVSWNL